MFKYNSKANYKPNGGHYLQVLSGKDLYKQTIVVSARTHGTPEGSLVHRAHDTFPVRFPNIFVDYPLGSMKVSDKLWTNWNKAPLKLWQTQLNFVVWCTSSSCGVSSKHLNYKKHPMITSVYCFHVYYHVRRVLERLQTPLPHETGFNAADNPYTESEFFKICEDYRVPTASYADASCVSETPPCLTLKKGRQPAKRLPENVRFTASLLRLAASNSSSEYISQTTKNSGEILKQLDSQGISFFKLINIFGRSVADVHKKASWLGRIEWHLWCMLYRPNRPFV